VALAACAVFVVLVAVHPFAPRLPRGVLQLTALDCGQGDALFLVLPGGTTMLLDAGGSRTRGAREGGFHGRRWDSGEDIVSPYLWSLGIKKIDVVAFTHANPDHAGGLYAILENFRVGEFWHAPHPETPEYAALLETVAERGIPTRTLMAGDALSLGDASIRVLWPGTDPPSQRVSRDDNSLVMRIGAGGMNFLLPGDAGRNAEKGILASGEPLGSQVLKVAHHGSKSSTSSDFLARVAPRVAIVSSEGGGDGGGGLSNPEMLEGLQNTRARIFRTDTDGATTVEGKDGSLTVRTYRGTEAVVITGVGGPLLPQ
jgi:competence protein ComEC